MKKFILMIITALMFAVNVNAQGIAGSSKATDNISVAAQVGAITSFNNFYKGHTVASPIFGVNVDKYVTPWLGFGIDARALVGTGTVGHGHNSHTAIDKVNVSGEAKWNVLNSFNFTGNYHKIEPIIYGQIGWENITCGDPVTHNAINHCTARAGVEVDYNINKNWGVGLNFSDVWEGIGDGKLNKNNGHFESAIVVRYHFGRWGKYRKPNIIKSEKKIYVNKEIIVTKEVPTYLDNFYKVAFAQNSAQLSNEGKAILDKIPVNSSVTVYASASPEGSYDRNVELINERASVVAEYLNSRGISTTIGEIENARQALIVIKR